LISKCVESNSFTQNFRLFEKKVQATIHIAEADDYYSKRKDEEVCDRIKSVRLIGIG
jgi:hypothetical protein